MSSPNSAVAKIEPEAKLPSPLAEANPRSLDELFAADPETLTDDDIHQMVVALRAKRSEFKVQKQDRKSAKAPLPLTASADDLLDLIGLGKPEA